MGNPWARSQPQFNKDRIQRDVREAKRIRETQTPARWKQPVDEFNKEADGLHKYLKGLQDRFRPSDSGSPKAMGNDSVAGNVAKLADKFDDLVGTLEQAAKSSRDLSGIHIAVTGVEALMAAVLIAQRLRQLYRSKPRPSSQDVQAAETAASKAKTTKTKTEAAARAVKKS